MVFERDVPSQIASASVTGDFFEVLGVHAQLGRALSGTDDVKGAEPVLVLTHRLWLRRYGGARDIIGRRLFLNDQSSTIMVSCRPTSNIHSA